MEKARYSLNSKLEKLNMVKARYSLNSKLEKLSKEDSKLEKLTKEESECTIYRVHRHLRNVNFGAYDPEVIAIGPYHHYKDHLMMMENHKLRNLQSLVKRPDFKYAAAVSSVESLKARKCYADQKFSLSDSRFIEMLVLDGCFIVELVRKFADGCLGEKGDDPIFGMEWMIISLQRDLMLFENQIPFFVLRNLFNYIKGPNETRTLLQLLTNFFRKLYPAGKGEVLLQVDDDHKIKHLLDLIHRNWVLPRLQQLKKDNKCQKPNPARTMYGMPLQEMKENEVVISSMPVQERNANEIVLGSMPIQQRKENEDMTGSMPLQERKENEVVLGSMPLQDMKGNEAVIGSMSVQEMKEKEIVTIDSMPVLERNETDFMVDMLFDELYQIQGSSMPVLERKETEFMVDMLSDETDDDLGGSMTDQLVGSSMPIVGSSMPVLERKETEFMVDMLSDETDDDFGGSMMPILERKDTDQIVGSSMPIVGSSIPIVGSMMPILERKDTDQLVGSSMPVLERKETNQVEGSSMPLQDKKGNADIILLINHATELTEANVEFEMKEKETLFDICFTDGVMVMPPLLIQDGTECFLRNLIVYEQYFQQELSHTVVTDYMKLLDNLIDSAKDVELLSKKGIIINWLGDAEVVANMVNRLGDLVTCGGSNFSYATEFEQVNKHCEKRWNKWMAKLRRDYLNSPWAIISIIAAVVLLLLTVTQTVLSILQVVQEN